MKIKKLEKKIQKIIRNEKFKISTEKYYFQIKELFSSLLINIVRLDNTEIGIEIIKKENMDLFKERKDRVKYIIECENTANLLRKEHYYTKAKFLDVIEELCTNEDFYKLLDDDLPYLISIINYFKENNKTDFENLINWIDDWLDSIPYEDIEEDVFYLLNEQFKSFYNEMITKKDSDNNERTRCN